MNNLELFKFGLKGGTKMRNILKRFDNYFIDLINQRMRNRYLDIIMRRVTDLGGAVFSSLYIFLLIIFGNGDVRFIGFEALAALSLSQIVVHSLKRILSRERPYKIIEQLNTYGINLKDYSFPSGHTAAIFSISTTIAMNIPKLSLVLFLLAIIVGISRIYLGVHYPTDVAAGLFLGLGIAFLVHLYLLDSVRDLIKLFEFN